MNTNQSLYFIPEGDEIVENWRQTFQQLEKNEPNIVFVVDPRNIEDDNVARC